MSQHSFVYKRTGQKIEYFDTKMMNIRHPNKDYQVVGEIDVDGKVNFNIVKRVRGKGTEIGVCPRGMYKEKEYKILGYIPCEDDEYVVVKKKKHIKQIMISLFILILLLTVVGLLIKSQTNTGIDPNTEDYVSSLKRPENIDESKILIPGYGTFTIEKGSDTIPTTLFNPEGNPCHFQFRLVEKETNRTLYESKLVPPGKGIKNIKMNKRFNEEGTYKVVLKFKTVDFEDTSMTYNGSDVEIDLIVK